PNKAGTAKTGNCPPAPHIPEMNSLSRKAGRLSAPDLFGHAAAPPGFQYAPGILTEAEEAYCVSRFAGLPFKPFEFHGYLGNRRVVSYGHRYDYSAQRLRPAEQMPDFLEYLKSLAGQFSGIPAAAFEQALVSEYAPGAGIGWHRDKAMFEDVVALSFVAPCTLRLRRKVDAAWKRRSIGI